MEYSKDILPITEICANLTEDCNFACRYCFTEHHPNHMSYKVAQDIVHWLDNNAKISSQIQEKEVIPHMGFFGGEPSLKWDDIIVPIVNYVKENNIKMTFSITSNCSLLTPDKVDFLRMNNIGLLISMDGGRET